MKTWNPIEANLEDREKKLETQKFILEELDKAIANVTLAARPGLEETRQRVAKKMAEIEGEIAELKRQLEQK